MTHGAPNPQDLEKLIAFAVSEQLQASHEASSSSTTNVIALSPAHRTDHAASRPTLERLLERYFDASSAGSETEAPATVETVGNDRREPAPPPRRRPWLAVGISLAAAAVLLVTAWPTPQPSAPLALLEEYTASPIGLWGGSMRGGSSNDGPAGCEAPYHVERQFGVLLRPRIDVPGPLVVRVHVRSSDGRSSWLDDAGAVVHDTGTIEVRASMAALGLSPGTWVARFFIMRRDQVLAHEALQSLGEGLHPGVTVVELPFCVVEE